jgi:hypothetical protein
MHSKKDVDFFFHKLLGITDKTIHVQNTSEKEKTNQREWVLSSSTANTTAPTMVTNDTATATATTRTLLSKARKLYSSYPRETFDKLAQIYKDDIQLWGELIHGHKDSEREETVFDLYYHDEDHGSNDDDDNTNNTNRNTKLILAK